jgi:RNA polymerase sigma factor for flagellar operon FliA
VTPAERADQDRSAEQLVEDHIGLAYKLAWMQVRRIHDLDLDEARQDACVGLIHASRAWNRDSGVPFGAYAHRRILGEILDGMRRRDVVGRRSNHDPDAPYLQPGPSLDQPLDVNTTTTVGQLIPAQGSSPEDHAVQSDLVRWVLRNLTSRERAIVVGHYLDFRPLQDIADDLGVTPSRVSQILKGACERMSVAA